MPQQLTLASRSQERIAQRAAELSAHDQATLSRRTDHLFAGLMVCQWMAGIAAALWISPRSWAGSSSAPHLHVYAAIVLGGIITAFPVLLALMRPGQTFTRHVIAAGQMLMSALLIHLTGGRIETHFHVFGSLAFLAFYRDWKVLVTASIIVALDHVLRGMFWPQSVYGVLTASPWRALEHAGWVAFEDAFLFVSIRRSLQATRLMAQGRAEIEASHGIVELQVEERTRELRESEDRFRSLSASAPVGIFETDAEGRCVYTNARWTSIAGRPVEDNLGESWMATIHPEDLPSTRRAWQEATDRGEEFSQEFRIAHPSGTIKWVRARAAQIPMSHGTRGYVGSVEDITETKQAESELIRAREAAIEAARLKSEFVANMSHEIRTPLASVIGHTELVLDMELAPEAREFLGAVTTSADALLTLLNDILDFSKVEAGKLDLEAIPFGLRDCLGSALKSVAVKAHQKDLELLCHVAPEVPDRLIGDPNRLRQVMLNLVGNAIKFTAQGEVVVRVALQGEQDGCASLEVRVSDTGVGIPADKQAVIFEAFTQADGSATRRYGGTGLGLTISAQLLELMGGSIRVESTVGQGSTFIISVGFPVDQSEAPPLLTAVPIVGKRVLVVDDSATNRSILTGLLDRWQARVLAVESGAEGLAALRRARSASTPFDLVVLDVLMPGMDGFAVAEAMMADPEITAPIIILTSAGRAGDAARCQAMGIAGYLTKPVMSDELLEALCAVLGKSTSPQLTPLVTRHALRSQRNRLRLLLAEDNPVNRTMIAHMLTRQGHFVRAVSNGREAIESLNGEAFDLILMDVQMPEMDGIEATKIIRAQEQGTERHIPILALTAHAMKGDRERCLQCGMDAYASKPIQSQVLFAQIEALVPRRDNLILSPQASSAPGAGLINLREVLTELDGDHDMLSKLLRLFLEDCPSHLARIERGLEAGEMDGVEEAAHALKGGLSALHASTAAAAADELEEQASLGDGEKARTALRLLQRELETLQPAIESALKAA